MTGTVNILSEFGGWDQRRRDPSKSASCCRVPGGKYEDSNTAAFMGQAKCHLFPSPQQFSVDGVTLQKDAHGVPVKS